MRAVDVDETRLAKPGADFLRLPARPLPPVLILARISEPPALPAIKSATTVKHAAGPVTVRTFKPHAPGAKIRRRIAIIDALDDDFAVTAVTELGVVFESVEADAAGPLVAAMPPKGAAPARAHEIVLAEIGQIDAMPGFALAGATIIPPAIPAAHVAPQNFSKSIGYPIPISIAQCLG